MKAFNIRSIFNLQNNGEWKLGVGRLKDSGFSYDPCDFIRAGSKENFNSWQL
jgi:hypothetical protein